MFVILDSKERNIDIDLKSTLFSTKVNKSRNDMTSRNTYRCDNEIITSFSWIGNSNNSTYSQFNSDSFSCNIIPISETSAIIHAPNQMISSLLQNNKNYFEGLFLFFDFQNKISRIMECSNNIIVTEEPIFKYYFENVSYVDYKDKNLSEFFVQADIINPSFFNTKNQFIILNSPNIIGEDVIVENVTKRWKHKVMKKIKHNLVLLDNQSDLPYEPNDEFIVYKNKKGNLLLSLDYDSTKIFEKNDYFGVQVNNNNQSIINSRHYYLNENVVLVMINTISQEKNFFRILDMDKEEESNHFVLYFSTSQLEVSDFNGVILCLLPLTTTYSSISLPSSLSSSSSLKTTHIKLHSLILPNKPLTNLISNIQTGNIPYLFCKIVNINCFSLMNNNSAQQSSSFVCFQDTCSSLTTEFKSFQTITILQEELQDEIKIRIDLPNNENLELDSKVMIISNSRQQVLLDNFLESVVVLFSLEG